MERPPSCPEQTLRSRALQLVEIDFGDVSVRQSGVVPEGLTLPELKLETDSMIALTGFLITCDMGDNEQWQQLLADHIQASRTDEGEHPLQTLKDKGRDMVWPIIYYELKNLRTDPQNEKLFNRLELYRQAYYERSPLRDGTEKIYASTEDLLSVGVNTATEEFAQLLYALNAAFVVEAAESGHQFSKDEKVAIAQASDHLPLLPAKLSLGDLEKCVNLINTNESLLFTLVELELRNGGYVAVFNKRVLQKARQLEPGEKPEHSHRLRKGCPASVKFEDYPSTISELWRLTVGALDKIGYWD